MNNFVGRKQELNLLNDIYENKDALILINGTNLIGKSKLIKEFIKDKSAFVFSASQVKDKLNKEFFTEQLKNYYNFKNELNEGNPTWEDLFRIYANIEEPKRKILVLDNLNYLIQNNPDFARDFINTWNTYLKPHNILVVGLLPNNSILSNLENQKKSLIDTVDYRIKLQPLNFVEILKDLPKKDFLELVSSYSMTSGMPQYLPVLINTHSVAEQIDYFINYLLDTNSFYNHIPLNFIEKNVWDPVYYTTVLHYLANGVNTLQGLVEKTGFKYKDVETYINNLILLGIIKADSSINEKRFKPKKAKFSFTNQGFRFWSKYIQPNQSLIDSGNYKKLSKIIQDDFPKYLEEPFKEISREILQASINQKTLNFEVDKIGSFWNKNIDVPIVAIDNTNKKLIFATTQPFLNDYTLNEFKLFIDSVANLKEFKKYKDYDKYFGLFTATNVNEEFKDFALENNNIIIFSGTTIYRKPNVLN